MRSFFSIALSLLFVISTFSFTDSHELIKLRLRNFNLKKGIALQQYDPVAYFTEGKAVKGSAAQTSSYLGVTYYFSSTANKEKFKESPEQYEPAFGGWCAYTMGHQASKEDADPKTFKIVNGRLLLFYNKWDVSLLPKWEKDEATLLEDADKNWKNLYR